MLKSKTASFIRGKRMRATRLDATGNPVFGDASVVTTKGFITAEFESLVEEGEEVNQANADGDVCVYEPGVPSFNGFTLEIEFCEVDFALFEILTGQPVVLDSEGRTVGITESTSVDMSAFAFALEMWLGADTKGATPSEGSQGEFGYVLMPFLSGGVIGDLTVENDAVTFTVSNITSKNGARWGVGPHKVELVGGEADFLQVPMRNRDHRRIMVTEVAPPTVYAGATPLLNPTDGEPTSVTAEAEGRQVAITVEGGSGGVFLDFGDGTWDYTESGSYVHEYDGPGSYTITARRGGGQVSTRVQVS